MNIDGTGQLPLEIPAVESRSIQRSAVLSDCGRYRYELQRRWADGGPLLDWIMLNPSTADADQDDPTIRRCMGFARDWGFNGIRVTNLFALRATNPDGLLSSSDPWGDNYQWLSVERGPLTVCAWGSHKAVEACIERAYGGTVPWAKALEMRSALVCLGVNKDGNPKHPLYVAANTGARPWPVLTKSALAVERHNGA